MKIVTASAPGKLILSGEHAVVKGCPAIAAAINYHANTTVEDRGHGLMDFSMPKLAYRNRRPRKTLRSLMQRVEAAYDDFSHGKINVRDILKGPFELLEYTAGKIADVLGIDSNDGLNIHTESNLPLGCGLGSSAASIVSMNYAILKFHQRTIAIEAFESLCQQAESMQHGKSSGLDIFISIYGGCWYIEGETKTSIALPQFPLGLINTGEPASSTGECVAHTQPLLDDDRCNAFTAVTQQMQKALNENNMEQMHQAIRTNHQLLCELGVVPDTVAKLIAQLEAVGASAKICGAGSIQGKNAGAVMILEPEKAHNIIQASSYSLSTLSFTQQGVHLV